MSQFIFSLLFALTPCQEIGVKAYYRWHLIKMKKYPLSFWTTAVITPKVNKCTSSLVRSIKNTTMFVAMILEIFWNILDKKLNEVALIADKIKFKQNKIRPNYVTDTRTCHGRLRHALGRFFLIMLFLSSANEMTLKKVLLHFSFFLYRASVIAFISIIIGL